MGSRENVKTDKEPKTPPPPAATATTQEQNPTTGVATDWTGFQAYSPMPPHGFMQSSPQPPHYMWGMQHIMPPYGTPPQPYVAMYPPGSMYAHPSMPPGSYPYNPYAMASPNGAAEASGNTPSGMEMDGKSSEGKEKLPIKRSKGSLGTLNIIAGKNNDPGKHTGASANGAYSKSAESGSENSSEGSDGNSQNDSDTKSGGRQESVEAEATQNGMSLYVSQNGGPGTMLNHSIPTMQLSPSGAPGGVPGPATNLNIGMDYWSTQNASAVPGMHGKVPAAPVAGALVTAGSRDSIQSQLWLKDERELKRQRRKQSNRESARRSRLRKQAECDELAQRAEVLKEENAGLRSEVNRIRSEYEQLVAENASLKERLGETPNREDSTSMRSEEQLQNGVQQTANENHHNGH